MSILDGMEKAINIMNSRSSRYNHGYKRIGKILYDFFPNGLELKTAEDFARFQAFTFVIIKMNRYAQKLTSGGDEDSALDAINYSAILFEHTDKGKVDEN